MDNPLKHCSLDISIDSDNTNGNQLPNRSQVEESIEMAVPGKFIRLNVDNDDDPEEMWDSDEVVERIPDHADGFDKDGHPDKAYNHDPRWRLQDNQNTAEDDFIPIRVKIDHIDSIEDFQAATLKFVYQDWSPKETLIRDDSSCDGSATIVNDIPLPLAEWPRRGYCPPNTRWIYDDYDPPRLTRCRLWRKAGTEQRNGNSVSENGDFVPSGEFLSLSSLGFSAGTSDVPLHLEAVDGVGSYTLLGQLDKGDGILHSDEVRFTSVQVDFVDLYGSSNNPDMYNQQELSFDATRIPNGKFMAAGSVAMTKVSFEGISEDRVRFRVRPLPEPTAGPTPAPVVSLGGVNDESELMLIARGGVDGGALVEAYLDTPDQLVIGELRVYVAMAPKKVVTVFYNAVCDPVSGIGSSMDQERCYQLHEQVKEIWLHQANIELVFVGYSSTQVLVEDIGEALHAQSCDDQQVSDAMQCMSLRDNRGKINVFFYPDVESRCDDSGYGGFAYFDGDIFIEDRATAYTLAHEIGHVISDNPHFNHDIDESAWMSTYDDDFLLRNNIMSYFGACTSSTVLADLTLRQGVIANRDWRDRYDVSE